MDLANQRKLNGSIEGVTSTRGQLMVAVAALALLAAAATWVVVQGGPARAGQGTAAINWVSDPVNVEFRRSEREGLGGAAVNWVSDPVNVEFRRGEREGLGAAAVNWVSDPVNVEFRRSEREGD